MKLSELFIQAWEYPASLVILLTAGLFLAILLDELDFIDLSRVMHSKKFFVTYIILMVAAVVHAYNQ